MQQHLMQMQPMMAAYYPNNVTTDHIQQDKISSELHDMGTCVVSRKLVEERSETLFDSGFDHSKEDSLLDFIEVARNLGEHRVRAEIKFEGAMLVTGFSCNSPFHHYGIMPQPFAVQAFICSVVVVVALLVVFFYSSSSWC